MKDNALFSMSDLLELADVAVDVRSDEFEKPFTYLVPSELSEQAIVGKQVLVPFGSQKLLGYIVNRKTAKSAELGFPVDILKPLIDVTDSTPLSSDIVDLSHWLSNEYVSGLGSSIHACIPPMAACKLKTYIELANDDLDGLSKTQAEFMERLKEQGGKSTVIGMRHFFSHTTVSTRIRELKRLGYIRQITELIPPSTAVKRAGMYRLNLSEDELEQFFITEGKKSKAQALVLSELAKHPEGLMSSHDIKQATDVGSSVIGALEARGAIIKVDKAEKSQAKIPVPEPTPKQAEVINSINASIGKKTYQPILLLGVTAGGKTEVYLRCALEAMRLGRSALYVVPEIALTAQAVTQIRARFGKSVALLHSRMTNAERYLQIRKVQNGECPIVVGARSAIFAPVQNLGLIVIDEEHETSYKQESQPRYHLRAVAEERAKRSGATVVFGSATPSIETHYRAVSGEIDYLTLPERVHGKPLPEVEIIDMRYAQPPKTPRVLGTQLEDEMRKTLSEGQQVILFINRRAFAPFLLCRVCGHVEKCPYCSTSLAYHSVTETLRCHHCDYTIKAVKKCASCESVNIMPFGVGTQRVEQEVAELFPKNSAARLDRDVMSKKDAFTDILHGFRSGEIDILIGTQMVAKGLDFPRVTTVGVVNADTGMHLPDFRAGERTFQLLTQVAGRAGRGDMPGKVVIQTFNPDHPSLEYAKDQDYLSFYKYEIENRRELNYPPFSRLVNFIVSHQDENTAESAINKLRKNLEDTIKVSYPGSQILGPSDCPISKLHNMYRKHCLVKLPVAASAGKLAREATQNLDLGSVKQMIDVDPISLL